MARSFDRTKSQFLERAAAAVSGYPCSYAAWVYPVSVPPAAANNYSYDSILGIGDGSQEVAAGVRYTALCLHANGTNVEFAAIAAHSSAEADYTCNAAETLSIGAWYHGAAVFASATSRSVYSRGGAKVTRTASNAWPPSQSVTHIGVSHTKNVLFFLASARIAEAAIWSIALSDAEVASLAKGYCPLLVRPESLVAYYPLGGMWGANDYDRWKRAYDLTPYPAAPNAPTWADHPPGIIYPPGVSL